MEVLAHKYEAESKTGIIHFEGEVPSEAEVIQLVHNDYPSLSDQTIFIGHISPPSSHKAGDNPGVIHYTVSEELYWGTPVGEEIW